MGIINYKILQVEAEPIEPGGIVLTNNFKTIADFMGDAPLLVTNNGALITNDSAKNDTRGNGALDLQGSTGKNSATQAATGVSSVILRGSRNKASGDNSVVLNGFSTNATGDYSTASGYNSNATQDHATAIGYACTSSGLYSLTHGFLNHATSTASSAIGYQNQASTSYSVATGRNSTTRQLASITNASGSFASSGDAQHEVFTVFATTTTASPFPLQYFDDGLFNWNMMQIMVQISAFNVTDSKGAAYILKGAARGSNLQGFTVIGSTTKETWEDAEMVNCDASNFYAHPTGIRFDVTGLANKTINWTATWHITYSCV